MPLGIVSNSDFELEQLNSDDSFEQVNPISSVNGTKIDWDESTTNLEKSDNQIINETTEVIESSPRASLVPEIVTSDMINPKRAGRHESIGNVPQSLRKIIAEESIEHGNKSAKSLVNSLGMNLSDATISTYKSGNVSPANGVSAKDNDLLEYINHRKTNLGKKALNKMSLALNGLTKDKMEPLEPKELASIAKDMSIIVDKMQPTKRDEEKFVPVQFVMMAPVINNENHYDVVKAKDNY